MLIIFLLLYKYWTTFIATFCLIFFKLILCFQRLLSNRLQVYSVGPFCFYLKFKTNFSSPFDLLFRNNIKDIEKF